MAAATVLAGCFRRPLLPPGADIAPHVLVSGPRAGLTDARARFREVWCAIRDDHGKGLPEDRPCDDLLWRLPGEGPASGRPFSDGVAHLATHGYRTDTVMMSGSHPEAADDGM